MDNDFSDKRCFDNSNRDSNRAPGGYHDGNGCGGYDGGVDIRKLVAAQFEYVPPSFCSRLCNALSYLLNWVFSVVT